VRKRYLTAVGLVAAAVTIGSAGAANAAPQTVTTVTTCGTTVTGYAVLAGDLTCTSGNGVTLTGDATLDLGGHTLTGPGNFDWQNLDEVGVVTSTTGRSRIVNGTIERWDRGVSGNFDRAGRSVIDVRGVRLFANVRGIDAIRSVLTVDRSAFDDGERGVSVGFSSFATVTRSTFTQHGEAGVQTEDSPLGVIVNRSTWTAGGSTGIHCAGGFCTVTNNVISGTGGAVRTFDTRLTLVGNDIVGNIHGYEPGSDTGSPEVVRDNRFIDNELGVAVYGGAFGVGAGAQAELRGNLFEGNTFGFHAEREGDYDILLDRNTFTRNGDGVRTSIGSPRLARNSAVDNTGWGIYAPGAVDLGGNTASGNGNAPQCVGVVCS
jgi:hypothetical protein